MRDEILRDEGAARFGRVARCDWNGVGSQLRDENGSIRIPRSLVAKLTPDPFALFCPLTPGADAARLA
jgi:hypothetical protein